MKKIKQQKGFTLLYAVLVSSIVLSASLSIINIALKQHKLSALSRESQVAFYAANTGIDCALYWETHTRDATPTGLDVFPAVATDVEYDDPLNAGDNTDQDAARTDSNDPQAIYCLGEDITKSTDFYDPDSLDPLNQFHSFPSGEWESHIQFSDSDDLAEYCLEDNNSYIDDYRSWIFQVVLPNSDGTTYSIDNACAVVSICKNLDQIGNNGYNTVYTAKGYNTCDITKENVVERGIRLIQD